MVSINTSAIRGFLVGNLPLLLILVLQVALMGSAHAFSSCDLSIRSVSTTMKSSLTRMAIHGDNGTTDVVAGNNRRSFLNAIASSIAMATAASTTTAWAPTAAMAAQEPEFRQGIKVNAFNGLIFNYRGGDFGGLSDEDVGDEPSVSYAEFNQRLAAGEVEFVEFLAPDGDKAYVTFKAKDTNGNSVEKNGPPIRIGEGYPIEKHDGFSSPLFCIRAVKNAGVPYKFVVPSLSKYSSS
ncbi:hypothetical protein IV203_036881 [Nitzschia inconspicua]|uniref:Uncharacterized protein n=1 Tax=Nitzschia inconspicua TaxID=303405 RepID=A0A9K3PW68_9STRA|nr:hypothetical protein IV203_036881 [Nitzschia inconspicua]